MGKLIAINISTEKGTIKKPVSTGRLVEGFGLEGDAHGGDWHRQVSLLAEESIEKMATADLDLSPGVFAENLTIAGISLATLPLGSIIQVGPAQLEITQIGKECHHHCEIRRIVGDCVMPREGIFAIVKVGGQIEPGDEVRLVTD